MCPLSNSNNSLLKDQLSISNNANNISKSKNLLRHCLQLSVKVHKCDRSSGALGAITKMMMMAIMTPPTMILLHSEEN